MLPAVIIKFMNKKNKKLLIIFAASAVVLAAIFLTQRITQRGGGGDENPSKYSASVLTAFENFFDFKTISMKDGKVSHKFEVKNDGEELVRIEKVYTSCMCTAASVADSKGKNWGTFGMPGHAGPSKTNITVEPGESFVVEAIFDPAAHGPSGVGLAERSVYLESNSQKSPKIELKFTAIVTN